MEKVFDQTKSICPVCKKILPANIYFKNGKAIMEKKCSEHGKFVALHHWGSEKLYRLISDVYKEKKEIICDSPINCEKCKKHKIDSTFITCSMTRNCNINCPFCFLKKSKASHDELYMKDFKKIAKLHPNKKIIILAGAEVTVRRDLFKIISFLRKEGFKTQILTNGINTANEQFVKKLKEAGINFISISFDLNPEAYKKLRKVNLVKYVEKSIENFKKYEIDFEIATRFIKENIQEFDKAIKFAAENGAYAIDLASCRDVVNGKPFLHFKTSELIEIFCKKFNIETKDLIQQLKYRFMGEKIRDYISFGAYKTHPCHIFFNFYRKNGKLIKINEKLEFKILYNILRFASKEPFLKILGISKRFKFFNNIIDYFLWSQSFYNKRTLTVCIGQVMTSQNTDLRYLQNCNAQQIVKKEHIENPVGYCYYFRINK